MRDEKGNLQLLPDEDELMKPKKPLTPYMLFVRDVRIHRLFTCFLIDSATGCSRTPEYTSTWCYERGWQIMAGYHQRQTTKVL